MLGPNIYSMEFANCAPVINLTRAGLPAFVGNDGSLVSKTTAAIAATAATPPTIQRRRPASSPFIKSRTYPFLRFRPGGESPPSV
ncbi:hypothetical protein GCM10011487_20450 [Steroidobacter agaridevorans]|uniref:Uncharacterized protein n=1 Tax=Steroidobacter agaridevorans TaxID=2695856 RepID=A0A829YAH2_9GAMM|nr:hypothetical protein GCM10011487_20450 [Steroidobacter agaridevorans]